MFEEARDCTLIKGDLVCSMMTISENAAPKNLCKDESSVQLQEARVPDISFHNNR